MFSNITFEMVWEIYWYLIKSGLSKLLFWLETSICKAISLMLKNTEMLFSNTAQLHHINIPELAWKWDMALNIHSYAMCLDGFHAYTSLMFRRFFCSLFFLLYNLLDRCNTHSHIITPLSAVISTCIRECKSISPEVQSAINVTVCL